MMRSPAALLLSEVFSFGLSIPLRVLRREVEQAVQNRGKPK